MKPKITICIPTYNRLNYLNQLLDSIIKQSDENYIQIAISDNASIDKTEDLVNEYS